MMSVMMLLGLTYARGRNARRKWDVLGHHHMVKKNALMHAEWTKAA